MNLLRKLLFPLAILYGLITNIRNSLYFAEIFKSTRFQIPTIVVGNLSVGGTGKTPMVEYIIRLLQDHYKVVTLSRGYKRQSKGFILANEHTTMQQIGDEPFQYHSKFEKIDVAVDAKRVAGITQILQHKPNTEVVVLDDAYQHLAVDAGFNILLTTYDQPYYDDWILPMGNLRESRKGRKRADLVVVTKCPKDLSINDQNRIKRKLKLTSGQLSFFSYIEFSKIAYSKAGEIQSEQLTLQPFILLAGIAKPQSFFDHLKTEQTTCLKYADHHNFSPADVEFILSSANGRKIITTEKDYVRLKDMIPGDQLYYLPIQTSFITDKELFDKSILNYVGSSTRNS